jgi:hypothetical protein
MPRAAMAARQVRTCDLPVAGKLTIGRRTSRARLGFVRKAPYPGAWILKVSQAGVWLLVVRSWFQM